MMTEYDFRQLLATFRKSCGFMSDPFEPLSQSGRFNLICEGLKDYPQSKEDEKVVRLMAILTECQRYLNGMKEFGHCFKPKFRAIRELMYQAAQERKSLASPQSRAKAQQRWGNLKKVYGPSETQGGKKLGEHYWKEIFDPRHRPPHFFPTREVPNGAGGTRTIYSYDELFDAWHDLVTPGSATYDPTFVESFFQYLDHQPDGVPNLQEYKYLEDRAGRETFMVLARGDRLLKKINGKSLDTRGWDLNNGFKNQPYEGSAQSMAQDHFIWVMSMENEFYSAPQSEVVEDRAQPGRFVGRLYEASGNLGMPRLRRELHHSAFMAGAPVGGGGEWHVIDGKLKVITGSSGHYAPPFENFQKALRTLEGSGINLSTVTAEWLYKAEDGFRYFNAKQLAMGEVKAGWLGWPKIGPRPLQPVYPMDPFTCLAIDLDVAGRDYPAEPPRGAQKTQITEPMQGKVAAAKAALGRRV